MTIWVSTSKFLEENKGIIGQSKLYEFIHAGRIPHRRVGRKILIPDDALDRLDDSDPAICEVQIGKDGIVRFACRSEEVEQRIRDALRGEKVEFVGTPVDFRETKSKAE
jgi:hypothetical protein